MTRKIALLFSLSVSLNAQEIEGVQFDIRDTGDPILGWRSGIVFVLLGLACFAAWRLAVWFLERYRANINWQRVRLIWPTVMLAWGGIVVWLLRSNATATVLGIVISPFALMNLPFLIAAGLLADGVDLPNWVQVFIYAVIVWGGNYLLVWLAEWRVSAKLPVKLDLSDP